MTTLTKTKPWNRRQLSDFKRAVIAHLWAETYFQDHIRNQDFADWQARWHEMVENGQAKSYDEAEHITDEEYEEERKWKADNWLGVWEEVTTLESVIESVNRLRKNWADKPIPAGQSTEDKQMPFPVEEHLEEKRNLAIAMKSTVWRDERSFQKLWDVVCFVQNKFTPDDLFSVFWGMGDKVFDEYKHLLADVLEEN